MSAGAESGGRSSTAARSRWPSASERRRSSSPTGMADSSVASTGRRATLITSPRSCGRFSGNFNPAMVHRLTKQQARQIAVRAQLLDASQPMDLVSTVKHLTMLQIDPTAAIAPSADLVSWSRLGSSYRPSDLKAALEDDRTLFEMNAVIRPMRDLGLYLAGASEWPPYDKQRTWLHDNDRFRHDLLDRLASSGPLSSRDIPDTSAVPWPSSGWTNN